MVRQENNLTVMGHTLTSELGPAGKALAVGLAMLAAQAGLSWLRHRSKAADRTSTLSTREPDTAVSERRLGQTLEEVLIQELEGDYQSRVFASRAVHSHVIAGPTDWRTTGVTREITPLLAAENTSLCSLATRA